MHYELMQRLWYRSGKQEDYVKNHVLPSENSRILDIGCGTGNLVPLLKFRKYVGFDLNPLYIRRARSRGINNCEFYTADVVENQKIEPGSFDIVMANGILHHLDDDQCKILLQTAHEALCRGGRLVTRDGCLLPQQTRLERWLLMNDRGLFVRTPEQYEELVRSIFKSYTSVIRSDLLRTPYSMIIFSCMRS